MTTPTIIATIRGQAEDIAEIRYQIARRLDRLVVATRIAGYEYTWLVQAA